MFQVATDFFTSSSFHVQALGNVIEVHHRPEDDDLDLSAPTHCPLPSGAILNRIVPGKAQSGKDQSQS